ncbi:hypothetical protein [Amedibacillus sp. YH-ame10]
MKHTTDTINLGITFQMTLDSFLEEKHPIKSTNKTSYEQALKKLEELKQFRNPVTKCIIATEAIQLCSDCIEGYMALGLYTQDIYERMDIYKNGMELATINLGKDFFLQNVTDFYDLKESRSLFHIKFAYACTLFELGFMKKALQQFQEILHLNPSDHFLVHHYVYILFLYFEDLTQCQELLNKYDTQDTFHSYVTFLLYLKQGEISKAKEYIPTLQLVNQFLYDIMTYKSMNMTPQQKQTKPGSIEEAGYVHRLLSKVTHTMENLHIFMS